MLSGDAIDGDIAVGETRILRDGECAIIYYAAAGGEAQPRWFDPPWWETQGRAVPVGTGRGGTWLVGAPGAEWVLRHYRRGGAVGRWVADRYFWLGLERTRPFAEFRFTHRIRALGLPAPRPVAARVLRAGLAYTGDLITERIAGAQSVSALLEAAPLPVAGWRAIGRCIRRFHDHGVCHADLNAHNILIDRAERVFLIDFDRGSLRAPGAWRAANLSRLKRSLAKICRELPPNRFTPADWTALQDAYDSGARPS